MIDVMNQLNKHHVLFTVVGQQKNTFNVTRRSQIQLICNVKFVTVSYQLSLVSIVK